MVKMKFTKMVTMNFTEHACASAHEKGRETQRETTHAKHK